MTGIRGMCSADFDRDSADITMFSLDDQIDRRILLQAESLIDAGYDVLVVAPPTRSAIQDAAFVRRLQVAAADINEDRVGTVLALLVRIYRGIHLRKILDYLGVRPGVLRSLFWLIQRRPDDFYMKMFQSAIGRLKSKVFVAHDLPMLPVAAAAARLQEAKVVYDSHELFAEQEITTMETKMWSRVERSYIGTASLIVTINDSIAEELASRYGICKPAIIMNCDRPVKYDDNISNPYFHYRFDLSEKTRVVLFQGSLSPDRNLAGLAKAFHYIQDESIALVFLGEGILARELKNLVAKFGLDRRVFFHQAVPQNRLLSLTRTADVGIIPYRPTCLNTYYCTPNKLFEFIAARVPVIATDLPEIAKIIVGHSVGLVGDTSTARSIAHLIERFFRLYPDKDRLRANLSHAAADLNWDVEGRKLVGLYRELIGPVQADNKPGEQLSRIDRSQ